MRALLKKISQPCNQLTVGALFFILFSFLANTFHEKYPDEFDNILGGWFVIHGHPLYTGFFTHHGPVAYLLAGIIEIFTRRSFVAFRIVYALFLFVFSSGIYLYFKKRFDEVSTRFYLLFLVFIGLSTTYFWGHMLLADSLSSFLLTPVVFLLTLLTLEKKNLMTKDIFLISILTSLATLAALTYIYFAAIVYLYTFFLILKEKKDVSHIAKAIGLMAIPYGIFLIYFLLTGSLTAYITQAIIFNGKYYAYTYPGIGQGQFLNPFKQIVIISHDFFINFYLLLRQVKDLNVNFPFNITLAVADVGFLIYLCLRKKFSLALFFYLLLTFANARSNPLTSGETDYQSAVYITLSFASLAFILFAFWDYLQETLSHPKRLIASVVYIIVAIYAFFGILFVGHKFVNHVYLKYMHLEGGIKDTPHIAPILNSLTTKNDYIWIGPFSFEELWYSNAKVPSNFIILLPEFPHIPGVTQKMMQEFNENKPLVIYFNQDQGVRGYVPYNYAPFFIDFLKENYVTVAQYKKGKTTYENTIQITGDLDIQNKLFLRKDQADVLIQKMLQLGYIHQKEK